VPFEVGPSVPVFRDSVPWRSIGAVLAIILGLAAAILVPRLAPRAALAALVESRVCPELGIACRVTGPIHARLFPYPAIEAKGLSLSLPDGKTTLSTARIVAELRALPLLIGRLRVNHIDLAGAEIDIAAPPGGLRLLASADGAGAALVDALIAAERAGSRLTEISLDRSRIVLHSEAPRRSLALEAVSGAAFWPQGGDLSAHFAAFIGGEAADLRIDGPSLTDITRTAGSPIAVNAVYGEDQLSYRGRLVKAPDLVAAGRVEAVLPSAKRLIRPLRSLAWPPWLPDAYLHVGGQAFATSRGVDFENAEFTIGRSHFSGGMSLRVTPDGRPSLSGTVASALVELGDFAVPRPEQVPLPTFSQLPDLDLRMSARRVMINGTRLDNVAAGLILADNRFDLAVSQGVPGEAGGKLRIVATPDEDGVAVKAQVSADNVDIGSVMASLAAHPGLSGAGGFSVALDGRGEDLAALMRSLAGKASLQLKKGALSLGGEGEPVASIAGSAAGEGPSATLSRRFTEASFVAIAERGVLTLTDGRVGEGATQVVVVGRLDLAERSVDLSLGGAGEAQGDAPWRLRLTGPWAAPALRRPMPATR